MIIDSNDFLFDGESREDVISSVSDEILLDNIKDQLDNFGSPNYSKENYVEILNTRVNYLLDKYKDDSELITTLNIIQKDMMIKILDLICNEFYIEYNLNLEGLTEIDYFNINAIYTFFVLNSYKNITNFFINFIFYNKKDLANQFNEDNDKKDLSYINIKKLIKNQEDITILYNFKDIIESIASSIEDDNFILEIIISEDSKDIIESTILNLFINETDRFSLKQEFSDVFFSKINNEEESNFELISDIKFEFLNLIK